MDIPRRSFLAGASALALIAATPNLAEARIRGAISDVPVTWNPVVINGGGLSDGFSTANDGSMLCRNDTCGAFRWDPAWDPGSRWVSISDQQRVTYPEFGGYRGGAGCSDVQFAFSNSNVIYQILTDQFGPNNLRAGLGYVIKSIDGGASFSYTNYPPNAVIDTTSNNTNGNAVFGTNNVQYKRVQNKLGVDPVNENVVYAANPGGPPLVTKDGGVTWSNVPSLPIATPVCVLNNATQGAAGSGGTPGTQVLDIVGGTGTVVAKVSVTILANGTISTTNVVTVNTAGSYTSIPQGNPVAVTGAGLTGGSVNVTWRGGGLGACCWSFDTNGGTVVVGGQTVTKNIYVAVELSGVWLSTDGGVSFTQIANDVGVNWPAFCGISPPNGGTFTESAFFIADNSTLPSSATDIRICRYNKTTNTWNKTILSDANSRMQLACHPTRPGVICSVKPGDVNHHFQYSNDYGATWTSYVKAPQPGFNESYSAPDALWVENQNNNFGLSAAGMLFRYGTDELWATAGQGIFTTSVGASAPATVTWTGKTAGLEQVVMMTLAHESGSKLLQICQDLNGFVRDTSALSTPPTNPINPSLGGLAPLLLANGFCGDIDKTDVNKMAIVGANTSYCGYSTDGGTTWAAFTRLPESEVASLNPGEVMIRNGSIFWIADPNFAGTSQAVQESYWSVTTDNGVNWTRLDQLISGLENIPLAKPVVVFTSYIDDNSTPGTYSGVAGNVMTVTAIHTPPPIPNSNTGFVISNPVGLVAANTTVSSYGTGNGSSTGTYNVNNSQAIPPFSGFIDRGKKGVYAVLVNGGTGNAIGDEITLAGGTFTTPAKIKVLSLTGTGGGISTFAVIEPGVYSVLPTLASPATQGSTTGSGSGATFNLSWSVFQRYQFSGFIDDGSGGGSYSGVAGTVLTVTALATLPLATTSVLTPNFSSTSGASPNGVTSGTTISALSGTGTGFNIGTYQVSASQARAPAPRQAVIAVPTGWGQSSGLVPRVSGCFDGSDTNTVYLMTSTATPSPARGVYKSTDLGATWTYQGTSSYPMSSGFVNTLRSVPGQAGVLFAASGATTSGIPAVHPVTSALLRKSVNGGVSWTTVANMLEPNDFSFGKAGPSGNPTLFVAGFYKGVYGIWMSEDLGGSFRQMTSTAYGPWPINNDGVQIMGADKDVYGRCYIGFKGSGAVYSTLV